MSDADSPEFPGIRTLTASEMFALDLNATALAEESACAAFWLADHAPRFASGGVIAPPADDIDSVPALLERGCAYIIARDGTAPKSEPGTSTP